MADTISVSKKAFLGDEFARSFLASLAPGTNLRLGSEYWAMSQALEFGRMLRDDWQHRFAILPGAINSFTEVASSREWMVIGKPRAASRAIDRLNSAIYTDPFGIDHRGWELLCSNMCLDWLTVGRAALYSSKLPNGNRGPIEYLDSTYLTPDVRPRQTTRWRYQDPKTGNERFFEQDTVLFNDCVKMGNSGLFLGKVAWLLPIARLDWYFREHVVAKLDGRRIRDIFFVADDNMVKSVEDALSSALALAMGESPEQHGLPVVSVGMFAGEGKRVEDLFARLGLSEVPEVFKPEVFEMRYVNEISSVLGLAVRYFWNPPQSSNRATEQVNQERQAVQGPSYWVRSLERTINNSDLLSGERSKVRLQVEEEVDSVSQERKAKTLKTYAEGIQIIMNIVSPKLVPEMQPMTSFGPEGEKLETPPPAMIPEPRENPGAFTPESVLSFFERQGLLSTDLTLPDLITLEENSVSELSEGKKKLGEPLDRGEVRMNREGRVLERRNFQMSVM